METKETERLEDNGGQEGRRLEHRGERQALLASDGNNCTQSVPLEAAC